MLFSPKIEWLSDSPETSTDKFHLHQRTSSPVSHGSNNKDPWARHPPDQTPPPSRRQLKRVVRILLECLTSLVVTAFTNNLLCSICKILKVFLPWQRFLNWLFIFFSITVHEEHTILHIVKTHFLLEKICEYQSHPWVYWKKSNVVWCFLIKNIIV